METSRVEINGAPATVDALHRPAVHNYGHFTSMQVRRRAVRGLTLHLERLERASEELFGRPVGAERVRDYLGRALRGLPDAVSVRINVFSLTSGPGGPVTPDVMVSVSSPVSGIPADPWHVCSTFYERDLPHIKHVGGFGLIHQRRLAHAAGFDDVLFVNRDGHISEGAIWNIGFWDGAQVVWPKAEMLAGITMQVLAAGLERGGVSAVTRPVSLEDLPSFRSAFATYSICSEQPVGSIDGVAFPGDDRLPGLLAAAWESTAPEPV
jgi:4-amino-4-deoxychorismate lyase